VVEGVIRPDSVKAEGPFGEFPGYYGRPEAGCPLVDITAVHYRSNPILTNALMADYPSCEQSGFFSVIRSAKIWDDLDKLGVPGIRGVYSHPAAAGGFGMTVVSLEQRYAGHAAQALALLAEALRRTPDPGQGLIISRQFYESVGRHRLQAGDPETDLLRRIGRGRLVRLRSGITPFDAD